MMRTASRHFQFCIIQHGQRSRIRFCGTTTTTTKRGHEATTAGLTRTQREIKRCKTGNMRRSKWLDWPSCASYRFRPAICSNTETSFLIKTTLRRQEKADLSLPMDTQRAGILLLRSYKGNEAYKLKLNKNICASSRFSLFVKQYKSCIGSLQKALSKPCPSALEMTLPWIFLVHMYFPPSMPHIATDISFNLNKNV